MKRATMKRAATRCAAIERSISTRGIGTIGAIVAVSLCGCMVGPDYRMPQVATPHAFRVVGDAAQGGSATAASPALPRDWWTLLHEPRLDMLEQQLFDANQDLAVALARHDEARAALGIARADRGPSLALDPTVTRARTSATVYNRLPALDTTTLRVPLDMQYEIDLWGRVRRAVAAANAQVEASADALDALALSLSADLATAYCQSQALGREAAALERTVALRTDALTLNERRARAGTVGDLDVMRARSELEQARADLDDVQRRRDAAVHAIAVLVGVPAPDLALDEPVHAVAAPDVPAGLPSQLLERRPDIAQAERTLAASSESIGIATAAKFPVVRLTGSAGYASRELSTLFESRSAIWSIGPSIGWSVFDGGRNDANVALAQARYREAEGAYRKQVLVAFREVQDALSDLDALRDRAAHLDAAWQAARDAARLTRMRYDRGAAGYLDVIDAERTAIAIERAWIQNEQSRVAASIALVKALGGGWSAAREVAAS